MRKDFLWVQTIILLAGTLFSCATVFNDFRVFFNYYHTLLRIANCTIPNPVTTACFYGSFAFLIAYIWSYLIINRKINKQRKSQRHLIYFLIGCTIFAWSNLSLLLYRFYIVVSRLGCSGATTTNPFMTPCFAGSVLFLGALVVGIVAYRKA